MSALEDNPHAVCPWSNCQCTHIGCVAGWIDDRADGPARPCPTCRPEVARHLATPHKTLRALRRELPNLARPTRGPARVHHHEETQR